jgi:DNA polymerase-4
MPLRRAREKCPDLTVLEPDSAAVEEASRAVVEAASFFTPVWEPAGPGSLYLDITGTERLWGSAGNAALRIKREIEDRTGLVSTVGMAGNKMVSNIASHFGEHEAVTGVAHGTEAAFLAPLKVSVLPGLGPSRAGFLENELGITRIGRLAALDPVTLASIFGRRAYLIRQRAMGIDPSPVIPPDLSPVVGEAHTFGRDTNDDRLVLGCLYLLVESCGRRLRERGLIPRNVYLHVRYSDRVEASRRCRLPRPSFWDFDLYPALEVLFHRAFARRVRVRRMEVVFRDFSPESGQLSLFDDPASERRKTAAIKAVDLIRRRYGRDAVKLGRGIGRDL